MKNPTREIAKNPVVKQDAWERAFESQLKVYRELVRQRNRGIWISVALTLVVFATAYTVLPFNKALEDTSLFCGIMVIGFIVGTR